ncbi:MAG: hypothetical protein Tsb0014_11830 [Pleurocapsa sp.]
MVFVLSSENVWQYLQEKKLGSFQVKFPDNIKAKDCKNFNLLVSFSLDQHLLVKQERFNSQGKTKGEFQQEWLIQQLFYNFSELNCLQALIGQVIDYDRDNSIIVFNYLNNYCDLADFYHREPNFSTAIAAAVGKALATIHRLTFNGDRYRDFLIEKSNYNLLKKPNIATKLNKITPEIFSKVGEDALTFYRLYQREPIIAEAIEQLNKTWSNSCLVHSDFRLVNILLSLSWQEQIFSNTQQVEKNSIIRIIDWERFCWGDPAFDLGTIIANYLKLWLSSLIVGTDIDLRTALSLATIPLEFIQPSLLALINSYLATFPKITKSDSNFITKAIQFAGLHLIELILAKIEYREPFDNTGICMLQVAKMLLCHPQESMVTVFGEKIIK